MENCCFPLLIFIFSEVYTKGNNIKHEGRTVKTVAIPIGINPAQFEKSVNSDGVRQRIDSLRKKYESGTKLVISVDRLDYIKGIPLRLDAVEELFKRYPEYVETFRLMQVVVPSRENIEGYSRLHDEIDRRVNNVNSKFGKKGRIAFHSEPPNSDLTPTLIGSIEIQPVQSLYSSIGPEELAALYSAADACIVSSTRDGMNIVAMEYVACQQQERGNDHVPGTLILSEFAGAADLMEGAVTFNPWDAGEFAEAIHRGLSLSEEDRRERQRRMYEWVETHTRLVSFAP